jgi:hypothetical protein
MVVPRGALELPAAAIEELGMESAAELESAATSDELLEMTETTMVDR